MKKNILSVFVAIVAALISVATVNAQSQFNKGDFALNLDYGFGYFDSWDFDGDGSYSTAQHSVGLMGEYGIMNVINSKGTIAVGGQIGAGFGSDGDVDLRRFRIATRGALHYSFIPQIDTYAGLTFCFVDINKWKYEYTAVDGKKYKNDDTNARFIFPTLFAGARYMVSDAFGFNVETSWDRFACIAVGVSFKF